MCCGRGGGGGGGRPVCAVGGWYVHSIGIGANSNNFTLKP